MKRIGIYLFGFFIMIIVTPSVFGASADGMGPWADYVVSTSQGLRKNGTAVPVIRSNPQAAVGVAENDTVEGNFYSLGFGGSLVLGFNNHQSGGVVVVEATNPNYPLEKAKVEVSQDGATWVMAGTVVQDGEVSVPTNVCVKYVRITDISNPSDFSDDTADGYDVDGVKLTGNACSPSGTTTTIIIDQTTICEVRQANTTSIINNQTSNASTGRNRITASRQGNIVTGNARSKNMGNIVGGGNTAMLSCCCPK